MGLARLAINFGIFKVNSKYLIMDHLTDKASRNEFNLAVKQYLDKIDLKI